MTYEFSTSSALRGLSFAKGKRDSPERWIIDIGAIMENYDGWILSRRKKIDYEKLKLQSSRVERDRKLLESTAFIACTKKKFMKVRREVKKIRVSLYIALKFPIRSDFPRFYRRYFFLKPDEYH